MDFFKKFKDFFGESNEIASSTAIAFEERLTSPFYGYFILAWAVVNWRLLYIAFFISGEEIYKQEGMLRNEYLFVNIPGIDTFAYWLHFLVYPFAITVFIFWIFPKVTRIYYKKSLRNQKDLNIIKLSEIEKEKKKEKDLVATDTDLLKIKVENEKQKRIAEGEAPEVIWGNEFEEFRNSPLFSKMGQVKRVVYENAGKTYQWMGGRYIRIIDSDILAFADTRNLVQISGVSQEEERVELTSKGKFFFSKYISI